MTGISNLRGLRFHPNPGKLSTLQDGNDKLIPYCSACSDNHGVVLLYMTNDNKYFILGQPLELVAQLIDKHFAETKG